MKINKGSIYIISAKNNDKTFDWESTPLSALEDVLTGVTFLLYKNPSTALASVSYFQKPEVKELLDETLDKVLNNLKFPEQIDKHIIKEQIFLSATAPLNNQIKNKIFKV